MDPRFIPLSLSLHIIILSLTIQSCVAQSQNDHQYQTCNQTLLRCGTIWEVNYPFWGGNRPSFCGNPGFELDCQANILQLNMPSSITYQVLAIDYSTQTLKLAREDLRDSICPRYLFNTTLNSDIFQFSSTSNDKNITLSYGCNMSKLEGPHPERMFDCNINGTSIVGFYGEEAVGNETVCDRSISVPVSESGAQALGLGNSTVNVLQEALDNGFWIEWSLKNDSCDGCVKSGGVCGYNDNTDSDSFVCYCSDGSDGYTCDGTTTEQGRSGLAVWQKYVIVGFFVIAGIVISCIMVFIRRRRKVRESIQQSNQNISKVLLTYGSLTLKRYNYNTIKKITKSFTDKLGQGGLGTVYKGKLSDGQLVAVKVLKENDQNGEEFINEVASISRTSHVNIVNLLGFCYERGRRALVYEFMPNKSLDKFIKHGSDASYLEWGKLYNIAVGVARGLEYLYIGCNMRIVHFDVKPQNILLDQDFCPKISDFGLAKFSKKKESMMSMLGTRGAAGYIAPELFSRNFGGDCHKSDVYSYGMMLLKMAGARKNDEIEATKSSEDYFPDKIYEHVLVGNKKLDEGMSEEDEETSRKMLLVGLWCVQTAPSDRPSMTEVVQMLEGSLYFIQIPPKPLLSSQTLPEERVSTSFSVIIDSENSGEF